MTNMKFFEQPLEKLFSFNKTSSAKNNNSRQQSHQSFNDYQHPHEGKSLRSLSSSCDTSMGTPVSNQRSSRQAKKSFSLSKTSLFGSSLNLSYNNNCFSSQDSPLKLPLPIQTLLTELYSRGPSTIGIFRKSPNAKQCKELRQKLEVNSDVKIDDFPVTVVASVLKEWLRSLPDCLLMSKLYDQWIEVAKLIELSSTTSSAQSTTTTTTSIVQNANNNNNSTAEQLHSRTQTTKEDTVDNCAIGLRNASLSEIEIENENVPQERSDKKSYNNNNNNNNHLLVERMLQQPLGRAQSCSTVNCETPISSPLSCSSNINNNNNNNRNNEGKQRQRHFLKSTQSVHNVADVNYNYNNNNNNNHRYANNVKMTSCNNKSNSTTNDDELDCHKIVQKLINSLDESNYAMLKALICVLRHIANNCEFNKMSAQNLGVCVGQSLLNDDNGNNRKPVKRHKRSRSQTLLSLTLSWSGVTGSSSSHQANNYKTSAQQQIDVAQDVAKYVPVLVGYMIENADQLFGSEISQVFAQQLSCGNQNNKNSTQNDLETHESVHKRDTNLNFANHYDDGGQKASLLKAAASNKQAKAAPVCLQTDLNSNLISLSPSLSQDVSHLACKQNVYARSPLFGKSMSLSSQSNSTKNLNSHSKQYQRRSSTTTNNNNNNNNSSATPNSNHRLLLTANRRAPPVPANRLVTHSNDDNKYRTTITIVNQHLYPTSSESTTSDSLSRTNIATPTPTTTTPLPLPSIPTSKANSVSGHCSADSAHASDEVCSSTSSSSNRSRTRAPSSVLGAHSPTLSSSTQSQSSSQAEISVQTSSSSSSANSSSVSSSSSSSDSPSSSSSFSSMSPTSAYSPTPPPSQTKSPSNIVSSTHQDNNELLSTTTVSATTALVSSSSSSPLSLPSSSSPSTSTDSFERLNATGALSSLQSELDYSIDVQPQIDTCDNSISSSPSSQRLSLLTRLQTTCAKQSPIESKAISSIKQQPTVNTSNLIDSTTNNNNNNNHLFSKSMNVSNQNAQQYKKSPISRMEMLKRRQMMNRYSTILGVPDRVPNIPVCLSTSNYGGEAVIYNPQAQQQQLNSHSHHNHHHLYNNNSQIAAASFDTSVDFMQRRQLQRQFSYHQLMIENQQRQQHYYQQQQQQQNQQMFNYAHHQFTNNTLGNPKNNTQRPISFSYKQTNSTTTNINNNSTTQNTNNNNNNNNHQQYQQHHNNHRQPPVLYTLL